MITKKKLIEVALPLEKINVASAQEKGNPFLKGHPRNLHQWWSRKPTTTARAVIFAQMVDDPSAHPELFPTEQAQEVERQRLFRLIEQLVLWKNNINEDVLNQARAEIWKSWRLTCAENADDPRAAELFNPDKLPAFHDPFAGGGSLPLEAQRLGLKSYASDLNPVAVLINKALIEIPPKFAAQPPVNPATCQNRMVLDQQWRGAQGLAEDVRYYSKWMRNETEKRIGHLYPKIAVTTAMVSNRPDLSQYVGKQLTVIAWLWARTVKSPNPAFAHVDVPLASTFMLSTKDGKEAYVEPVIEGDSYRFTVKVGTPNDPEAAKNGTKLAHGANFRCLMSETPIVSDYIKAEGMTGRIGTRLMAIVAEGTRGRVYLAPTPEHEAVTQHIHPAWKPETPLPHDPRNFWTVQYGLTTFGDLFTPRQLVVLNTFSDLVQEARERVRRDALVAGMLDDQRGLDAGGVGTMAYADAVSVYLAFAVDKLADYSNAVCTWNPTNQNIGHLFTKQAIPMVWGFSEASLIQGGLSFDSVTDGVARTIELLPSNCEGWSFQQDCSSLQLLDSPVIISTDPPYYDNISYADLSEFFYIWLRRALKSFLPTLFARMVVPRDEELVATPYRHGSKDQAEHFFLNGMAQAMQRLAEQTHPGFPITIYYAFKQSESENEIGTTSTGWETFLDAVIRAGFGISGTWPMRTERKERSVAIDTNALASSIVLVCRSRPQNAPTVTRRDFISALQDELPIALANMQRGNIAPVDLAQAALGPGMAVFTRYGKVLDASGKALTVREALALINQTLDEVLAEQEGDFDADTRWALAWFEQYGFADGEYGVAETLSKAKNTSVGGLVNAGLLASRSGKVRLLRPNELAIGWDPTVDTRLTVWEMVHHLVRALESGEQTAAALAAKLGERADVARELAYRLYALCERKKRAAEALAYNSLVQSWPEMMRLASDQESGVSVQQGLGL